MAGRDEILRLFVPGRARTKGHMKPQHVRSGNGKCRATLREDNPESTAWKAHLVRAVREHCGITVARVSGKLARTDAEPYSGALEIHLFFRFDVRESLAGGAVPGALIPSHQEPWPIARDIGDVDTLDRNVFDACTQSGLISDDSVLIGGVHLKRWTREGEVPGVEILVRPAGAWATNIESVMLGGYGEQCAAETHSWEHFTPQQMDSYYIRCSLTDEHAGPHEDSTTGLSWTALV